jgi:hypothetical protein
MMNGLVTLLIKNTYRRSDIAYQISLAREFLEYVFFIKHDTSVSDTAVEDFLVQSQKTVAETVMLRMLPREFFGSFTQATFYETLEQLVEEVRTLKTISLTVPVVFAHSDIEAIGVWARSAIDARLLIDIDVDPTLAVGCRVGWNNRLHDFSLSYLLARRRDALHAQFATRLSAPILV